MHHHHFVIALAAVSLIYCGGAPVETSQCGVSTTTTVNDTATVMVETPQCDVSTTTTDSIQSPPIDTADIRIFNEIFSKDGACLESNYQTGYPLNELFYVREYAFSFPFEDGSWLVIIGRNTAQEGSSGTYSPYTVYRYKNGEAQLIEFDIPVPDNVSELLDPIKCRGHEQEVDKLNALYKSDPKKFIVYKYNERLTGLELELMPHDDNVKCDYSYLSLKLSPDKLPLYIWDGEKFFKSK